MTKDEFRVQLSDFLMVEAAQVEDSVRLDFLGWDSLALLSVIGAAEEAWGIEVSESELNACVTVGDLLAMFDSLWSAE